jgi:hypothetical protein
VQASVDNRMASRLKKEMTFADWFLCNTAAFPLGYGDEMLFDAQINSIDPYAIQKNRYPRLHLA